MLVGILTGTYSSIFFATPLLVTLRERTDMVRTHTRRVMRRRKPADAAAAADDDIVAADEEDHRAEPVAALAGKPAPGARPVRPSSSRAGRPSGKRSTRRR
jgi:preprotein translocase subunit SecF